MDELVGEAGMRSQGKWGVTPCCSKAYHMNCLHTWVQMHGNDKVDAPCQEVDFDEAVGHGRNGGMFKKDILTHKQCPSCRKPMASSRVLLFC